MTQTKNLAEGSAPTWLVLAIIGDGEPVTDQAGDEYEILNTIVMAERQSEQAANAERDRRHRLSDGATYFVMTADEHDQASETDLQE